MQNMMPKIGLILAMVLWSSSFVALKIAFQAYDPMVVIFGRMVVASLCFLLVGFKLRKSFVYRKGDYKLILFMAFCEPCLYFLFEAKAIVYTTASQAGMITAILPVLVMAAAAILLNEKVRFTNWFGGILALLGVCWLTIESSPTESAPNPVLGNFYEFLAMVCATGYTISMRKLTSNYSPFFLTAVQAFLGSFFYFPFMLLPSTQIPTELIHSSSFAVVYLGACITLGAYGLYNYGLKYIPASQAASYINLIPVLSVLMGWLILNETLNIQQICAAAIVMTGVWFAQRKN